MKVARKKLDAFDDDFQDDELNEIYTHMLDNSTPINSTNTMLCDEAYSDGNLDNDIMLYRPRLSEQDIKDTIKDAKMQSERLRLDLKKRVMHLSLVTRMKHVVQSIDEGNACLYETNEIHMQYLNVKKKLASIKKKYDQKTIQIEKRYELRKQALQKSYDDDIQRKRKLDLEI